jgi:apolipoprotein N-acyltransferase
MAFNIDDNRREPWIALFAEVARKNNIYLVVGYISARQGNRLFVMNPQGDIIADYLKTYLSPPEWGGKHGKGELPHIDVEGISVGAMICHDDNFSRLTRYYGRYKTPLVMIPTWDWYEVRDAHLSAVRARAIECRYGIARSAYHGIAAIIGPSGDILARHDTQSDGHGYCIADVPLYQDVTVFARLGHTPMVAVSALLILAFICRSLRRRKPALADG